MIHKKLLSLLVLLMTAASGAWADIAQGDTFMFGSDIDFGNGVWCKIISGGTSNDAVRKSTKLPLTYGGYENGEHKLVFNSANGTSYLYIVDANSAKPWGIKVIGGDGTSGNPFVFYPIHETGELTIGADGACFFAMPASDATVDYDIVRDMEDAEKPVEFSGLAERVVVKKKTGSEEYEPLTPLTIQLIDPLAATDAQNIIAADGIKVNVLKGTENNGTITYDETNPIEYAIFTANMAPGLYKIVAEPTDATTSPYTGTASLEFETLTGYPVDVPAGEYVTYYRDEPLYADATTSADAKLYTITSVSDDKAVLSSPIATAPKLTPLLIYNSGSEAKTFLLIPATTEPDEVAFASEFKGTLTGETIAASTTTQNDYAFNGKKFVWVMNDLEIGANKAWLSISATSGARVINLVFDDATRIDGVARTAELSGDYYDLNGRKLAAKPTRKGVYIQNGKKVVVK